MSHSISTKPGMGIILVDMHGPGNTIWSKASIFPGISECGAKRVPNELIQSSIFTQCRGDSLEADFLPPRHRWKGQQAKLQPDESFVYHPISTVGVFVIAN